MKKNNNYYNESYFAERETIPTYLVDTIKGLLKRNGAKTVLEVGCGSGYLLKKLRSSGYIAKGIDISPIAAKLSGGKVGSATDIPYVDKRFNAVLGISIIEHLSLRDGKKFIKEAKRVLKSNGLIFLVTPNYNSPNRYIKGKKWFGYSDKSHIYFYTPGSLSNLLEKYDFSSISCRFPTMLDSFEWPLPSVLKKSPKIIRRLINYLLISSPIALYRDSFWISGNKTL